MDLNSTIELVVPSEIVRRVDRRTMITMLWSSCLYTLDDIGTMFGITRERVRQIIEAIEKKTGEIPRSHWLSIREAAVNLEIPYYLLLNYTRRGLIISHQKGKGKMYVINIEEISRFRESFSRRRCRHCGGKIPLTRGLRVTCSPICSQQRNPSYRDIKKVEEGKIPSWAKRLYTEVKRGILSDDEFVGISQAAKYCGYSRNTIYRLIYKGLLSHAYLPCSSTRRRQPIMKVVQRQIEILKSTHPHSRK